MYSSMYSSIYVLTWTSKEDLEHVDIPADTSLTVSSTYLLKYIPLEWNELGSYGTLAGKIGAYEWISYAVISCE